MALLNNNILQIDDLQTYLGQTVLNVYHFQVSDLASLADYESIANVFQGEIIDTVKAHQNNALTHTRIIVRNLSNGIDIYEKPIAISGSYGDSPASSLLSFAFRLVRSSLATRHGQKRFAGVGENMVVGNDAEAVIMPALNATAVAIGSGFSIDSGGDYDFTAKPVILGRFPTGHAQAGEIDITVVNPVLSAQYIRLTTQTTRRAGRGV